MLNDQTNERNKEIEKKMRRNKDHCSLITTFANTFFNLESYRFFAVTKAITTLTFTFPAFSCSWNRGSSFYKVAGKKSYHKRMKDKSENPRTFILASKVSNYGKKKAVWNIFLYFLYDLLVHDVEKHKEYWKKN